MIDDSGLRSLQEWYGQNICDVRIAVNHWLFEARPALNMPCQDKHAVEGGSRLYELKGRTEVMLSMAARGYWKLGAIGCRGASWSEQLDGKKLRGEDSPFLGTVFMASPPFFNYYIVVC